MRRAHEDHALPMMAIEERPILARFCETEASSIYTAFVYEIEKFR